MANAYLQIAQEALFPAILILLFGYILGTANIINNSHVDGINRYTLYISIPFVILYTMGQSSFGVSEILFLVPFYIHKIVMIILLAIPMLFIKKYDLEYYIMLQLNSNYSNNLVYGNVFLTNMYTDPKFNMDFLCVLSAITDASLEFPYSTFMLELNQMKKKMLEKKGSVNNKDDVKISSHEMVRIIPLIILRVIKSPLIWAMILGILVNFLHIKWPLFIQTTIELAAHSNYSLCLFLIGLFAATSPYLKIPWGKIFEKIKNKFSSNKTKKKNEGKIIGIDDDLNSTAIELQEKRSRNENNEKSKNGLESGHITSSEQNNESEKRKQKKQLQGLRDDEEGMVSQRRSTSSLKFHRLEYQQSLGGTSLHKLSTKQENDIKENNFANINNSGKLDQRPPKSNLQLEQTNSPPAEEVTSHNQDQHQLIQEEVINQTSPSSIIQSSDDSHLLGTVYSPPILDSQETHQNITQLLQSSVTPSLNELNEQKKPQNQNRINIIMCLIQAAVRMIISPLVMLGIILIFPGLQPDQKHAAVLINALPVAIIAFALSKEFNVLAGESLVSILLQSFILTFPAFIAWFKIMNSIYPLI